MFVEFTGGHIVYLGELMTRTDGPMQSPILSQRPLPIAKYESSREIFNLLIVGPSTLKLILSGSMSVIPCRWRYELTSLFDLIKITISHFINNYPK